jgi:pimeloyl-ACP methyl ester carboxylesterase
MPAVFVHGCADTNRLWDGVRQELKASDSIALKLPGFDAPVPEGFGASKEEYVDWIIARIEEVGAPVDLVGHDWGGMMVARVASLRPDLILTLATGDAPLALSYEWHPLAIAWQAPSGEAWMEEYASQERWIGMLRSAGFPEQHVVETARYADASMRDVILKLYRSAVNVGREWVPDLSKISKPTMIFWGLEDWACPVALADELGASLHAERIVKLHSGHWTPLEQPRVLANALDHFWNNARSEKRQQNHHYTS